MKIEQLTAVDLLLHAAKTISKSTREFCDSYCKYGENINGVPTCLKEGPCLLMDDVGFINNDKC